MTSRLSFGFHDKFPKLIRNANEDSRLTFSKHSLELVSYCVTLSALDITLSVQSDLSRQDFLFLRKASEIIDRLNMFVVKFTSDHGLSSGRKYPANLLRASALFPAAMVRVKEKVENLGNPRFMRFKPFKWLWIKVGSENVRDYVAHLWLNSKGLSEISVTGIRLSGNNQDPFIRCYLTAIVRVAWFYDPARTNQLKHCTDDETFQQSDVFKYLTNCIRTY